MLPVEGPLHGMGAIPEAAVLHRNLLGYMATGRGQNRSESLTFRALDGGSPSQLEPPRSDQLPALSPTALVLALASTHPILSSPGRLTALMPALSSSLPHCSANIDLRFCRCRALCYKQLGGHSSGSWSCPHISNLLPPTRKLSRHLYKKACGIAGTAVPSRHHY
ncbi:hypothetical protein DL98DRAFT_39659 [Cadophora sp. DSE1049]|nr:hypothetical protein DL98DRAFT_39659 [Cadophora sp. DSE1049]